MMNKLFKRGSFLHEFRWLLAILIVAATLMLYHDLTGRRMFTSSAQQQWNSSGPGYHK
ncbi:MAG TPA: hypothetical protein VK159_09580 [Lacibacter sp.]|nr:hypothetical protein [Lacibacter sp.]